MHFSSNLWVLSVMLSMSVALVTKYVASNSYRRLNNVVLYQQKVFYLTNKVENISIQQWVCHTSSKTFKRRLVHYVGVAK